MFHNARFKLTAWYLTIIMSVSLLFSAFIYKGADAELSRIERRQQIRVERFRAQFFGLPDFPEMFAPVSVDEIREPAAPVFFWPDGPCAPLKKWFKNKTVSLLMLPMNCGRP
ncbi:MAG: hypothetical protein UV46_C0072G0006 [Candidatus Gottesmanbacteria bacterium GW2011_GWC2_42_8]|nr:MAG: hypothetical protein UV46_C0072G0006 [Candidatus Gottesmanbacteria bacterium GW2011_GWC2_42_8]